MMRRRGLRIAASALLTNDPQGLAADVDAIALPDGAAGEFCAHVAATAWNAVVHVEVPAILGLDHLVLAGAVPAPVGTAARGEVEELDWHPRQIIDGYAIVELLGLRRAEPSKRCSQDGAPD